MTVRTRFAPSPTGYLHIGGVRTALFNWLFARKHGGQFILRIDDTDQQRNVKEALQPILDGFRWLGLDWDEGPEVGGPHGPYYQSQKLERYQQAVKQLLDKGLAYWDYARPEETKAEMEAAEKEKRPKIYSRRWMAETDIDRKRFEAEGRQGAVKAKMPRAGTCRFFDHIRGDMAIEWATEQDTVIQRSDGTVTYNLANVVDDFDMKISHVIRAEEHLSNTPRQLFMLEGLGYPRPEYAHVPFVAEPGSKNKLSKRKIAQYLKNADFKKVYEHGRQLAEKLLLKQAFEIAAEIKRVLPELLKTAGMPDAPKLEGRVLEMVVEACTKQLTERTGQFEYDLAGAAALAVSDTIEGLLRNPAYLESYEYGERVLKRLGPDLPPEAFSPVLVAFYKHVGYSPAAVLNYLVLLGWSFDESREDFTLSQMIELFSLGRVNKAPASFDVKKLFAFQERYMQALPVAEKVDQALPFLERAGFQVNRQLVTRIMEAAGPRLAVAGDILEYDYLFLPDDAVSFNAASAEKAVKDAYKKAERVPPLAEVLPKLREAVASAEPFDAATLKQKTEALAEATGGKAGPLSQVLRVATTGKDVGFSAYDTLAILGRERCLNRIDRALNPPA